MACLYTSSIKDNRNRRQPLTDKFDDWVGHLNTLLARGGGNLNDPIFKSSNALALPGGNVEVSSSSTHNKEISSESAFSLYVRCVTYHFLSSPLVFQRLNDPNNGTKALNGPPLRSFCLPPSVKYAQVAG